MSRGIGRAFWGEAAADTFSMTRPAHDGNPAVMMLPAEALFQCHQVREKVMQFLDGE